MSEDLAKKTLEAKSVKHESSFDIQNPKDFLHKLIIPQYQEFLKNNSSSRHALLTIILVHHMYDWVHDGTGFKIDHFKKKYNGEGNIAEYLKLARSIANGTKHFSARAETYTQPGFSSGFSYGFAKPLNVKTSYGKDECVDKLLEDLINFWKKQEELGAF